ncbi:putative integral membrane protein [Cryptosporidium felis]|nr:putative integral membrane protein [Cryptosporidium felis]
MWTLLRTSHRFTPKVKSFADRENAVGTFQSGILMNANAIDKQQYIPPKSHIPLQNIHPQHFDQNQYINHNIQNDRCHCMECNHQPSSNNECQCNQNKNQVCEHHCCHECNN